VLICFSLQFASAADNSLKPIQQFQDSCNVVIAASRQFLSNQNTIEQNKAIDDAAFENAPIDLAEIDKIELITPAEIKLRTDALDALAQYTSNLADLALGKNNTEIGDNSKKLSDSLTALAGDAKKLPVSKTGFLLNAKFSGAASAAAMAVGLVAQMFVEHKARTKIYQSIVENDGAITALIALISSDAELSYERQKNQLGAYGTQLSRSYEVELVRKPDPKDCAEKPAEPPPPTDCVMNASKPDPIVMLNFASLVKTYRAQQLQLSIANPGPAIDKMKTAHQALVSYIKSENKEGIASLRIAMQEFVDSAQALGQAAQTLPTATKTQ
jgi:hypothetical protein